MFRLSSDLIFLLQSYIFLRQEKKFILDIYEVYFNISIATTTTKTFNSTPKKTHNKPTKA